ncbi:MAG TPA: tetratricopeptide repeat protein [Thermoanaerobaculia bacterium]|nr:tetratricopeptide repeat protein [Thermoanaerobaculia bacterium]
MRFRQLLVTSLLLGACSGVPAPISAPAPAPAAEAVSLLGKPLVAPALPPALAAERQAQLTAAERELERHPDRVDSWVWAGRRLAYLGRYREAIEIYTRALGRFPGEPHLLRHRGHRFLTVRRLDEAVRDFERALEQVVGQPDEIEPDGLPNAANVPTSSLQGNLWYHLGLARYLQGDWAAALAAYREGMKVSTHPDMEMATRYWLILTLRRLGLEVEARQALAPVRADQEMLESGAYQKLLLVYRGDLDADRLLAEARAGSDLDRATVTYGVGLYFQLAGDEARARELFRELAEGPGWASFGALAAEAELARGR